MGACRRWQSENMVLGVGFHSVELWGKRRGCRFPLIPSSSLVGLCNFPWLFRPLYKTTSDVAAKDQKVSLFHHPIPCLCWDAVHFPNGRSSAWRKTCQVPAHYGLRNFSSLLRLSVPCISFLQSNRARLRSLRRIGDKMQQAVKSFYIT